MRRMASGRKAVSVSGSNILSERHPPWSALGWAVWAGVAEFQLQAHGFGWNQNVRENDHRINPKPAKGLDGDFDRKLGVLQTSRNACFARISRYSGRYRPA